MLEENDATKAHQSAQNFRPDLILLDIMMPETDGGEVAGTNRVPIRSCRERRSSFSPR